MVFENEVHPSWFEDLSKAHDDNRAYHFKRMIQEKGDQLRDPELRNFLANPRPSGMFKKKLKTNDYNKMSVPYNEDASSRERNELSDYVDKYFILPNNTGGKKSKKRKNLKKLKKSKKLRKSTKKKSRKLKK